MESPMVDTKKGLGFKVYRDSIPKNLESNGN